MKNLRRTIKLAGTGMMAGAMMMLASTSMAKKSGEVEWLTDFEKAKEMAAEKNRPILADFSGSDWCGWCIKLKKEVFSKKEFKEFAEKELVLLLVDFPRNKEQSAEVKKQNKRLAQKYGIRGFPTILLLDSDGKVIERTGYKRGGAEKYVEHLKDLLKSYEPSEKSDDSSQASAEEASESGVINSNCPIMGSKIDPDNVPEKLTREFEGKKIGFCCAACPKQWDKLSDKEKRAKLEEMD